MKVFRMISAIVSKKCMRWINALEPRLLTTMPMIMFRTKHDELGSLTLSNPHQKDCLK